MEISEKFLLNLLKNSTSNQHRELNKVDNRSRVVPFAIRSRTKSIQDHNRSHTMMRILIFHVIICAVSLYCHDIPDDYRSMEALVERYYSRVLESHENGEMLNRLSKFLRESPQNAAESGHLLASIVKGMGHKQSVMM